MERITQCLVEVLEAVYVMMGVFVVSVLWAVVWLADNCSYDRSSSRC